MNLLKPVVRLYVDAATFLLVVVAMVAILAAAVTPPFSLGWAIPAWRWNSLWTLLAWPPWYRVTYLGFDRLARSLHHPAPEGVGGQATD